MIRLLLCVVALLTTVSAAGLERECGDGDPFPAKLFATGHQIHVRCTNNQFVAVKGYRLVRDNVTRVVVDAVDINECHENPFICCENESKCIGPGCVKCVNIPGSYTCQSDSISCDMATFDKKTCKCQGGLPCTKNTAWYADCDGKPAKINGLDKEKRVCSRLFDSNTNGFISFDSEQTLFDFAVKKKCDCCFLAKKPEKFSDNPLFNYYGACKNDNVECVDGTKAITTAAGPWCPIKAKLRDLPNTSIGDKFGESVPDPTMCSPLPKFCLMTPEGDRINIFTM